jgi:hypothetical protein
MKKLIIATALAAASLAVQAKDIVETAVAAGSFKTLATALQAEVGVTAETPEQLCQVWLNLASGWVVIAAMIENLRFTASAGIAAATTPAEIAAVMAAFSARSTMFQGA